MLSGERLRWRREVPLDERIGEVTAAQQEVISVAQLRCCGLSGRAARGRVRSGRLRRIHRGVYTVSHGHLPPFGPVAAALLACARPAWASHRTGAWVRDLRRDGRSIIDVIAGHHTGRMHRNVCLHWGVNLRPCDVDIVNGLPVTSVARTLLDCAPVLGQRGTEKLVREAEYRGEFDLESVTDLLLRVPGHPGRAVLRAAIGDAADGTGQSASPSEDALLNAFRAIGVTGFECNAPVALDDGTFAYPDFLFRAARLVVEADPRGSHDRTSSYRSDRRRDRVLKRVADLDTMRFSDADLCDPRACALEVADRLTSIHGLRTG